MFNLGVFKQLQEASDNCHHFFFSSNEKLITEVSKNKGNALMRDLQTLLHAVVFL